MRGRVGSRVRNSATRVFNRALFYFTERTKGTPIYIEGGLGSQLLAMMEFISRRDAGGDVFLETSYFDEAIETPQVDRSGYFIRPWELHRYGFDLEKIPKAKTRGRLPYEASAPRHLPFFQGLDGRRFLKLFPVVPETATAVKSLGLSPQGELVPYAAIHCRRGDYLAVASKIVALADVLVLVRQIAPLLPRTIVFTSDTDLDARERREVELRLEGHTVVWLPSQLDPHVVHGVLRLSSILITSNSTFSLTAGILKEDADTTVFMPTSFHSNDYPQLNQLSQALGAWSILR